MGSRKKENPDLFSEVLAGKETDQGHEEKLRKYSGAKKHSNAVASYIIDHEGTLFKEAELLKACSSWLIFRFFYTKSKYRLIGGCTCKKHLLCGMCALRRSAKTVMAYSEKIAHVMQENPGLQPVLVTLTVKNGADLDERTQHLESAFTRMVDNRRRAKAGSRHTTIFRKIHGAAGAFEFKRGSGSGLWHPHIHMIALVPVETDLMEMEWFTSEEWRGLTKDSHNVDITPIDMSTEESRMKAICEVFRYALKFGEMEIADQVHAYKILKGKRLVRDFGSLHGVKVPEDNHDSVEEELALQPYVDLVYEYSKKKGFFLSDVTDTGDLLTAPLKKAQTTGEKAASRLSAKLFLQVKDHDKPGKTRSLDQNYMNQWAKDAEVETTYKPEEVPF
jgi:plasmid rolling circle replication initiator protein Rep